jgi:DUF917 family protein
MRIGPQHLVDLAAGAAFLGTGGGGDPYIYRLATAAALHEHGDVELVNLDDLPDSAVVMSIGGAGAPTIGREKLPNGLEGQWALRKLEAYLGKRADALIADEIGGGNGLVPILTAAHTRLPVVDGDGMGRAYPETQMMTFSIYGVSATPMSAVDEFGDGVVITARDSATAERIVRQVGLAMGGQCMCADHAMDAETARRVSVKGTVTLALELGRQIHRSADLAAFVAASRSHLEAAGYGAAVPLLEGKVVDVSRDLVGGYDVGVVKLESFTGARTMQIMVRNEYLVAIEEGRYIATVPDLICIVDNDTLEPITSERICYGQRVAVIGVGAPPIYRTPEALAVTGPRAFGFDADFTPLDNTN